jgi:hypothetical protein
LGLTSSEKYLLNKQLKRLNSKVCLLKEEDQDIQAQLDLKADLVGGVVPTDQLPIDQNTIDALNNANAPTGTNYFTTLADLSSITPGTLINVVSNYSALPAANTVPGEFYWVENPQGTSWLPGPLGGTYYTNGLYYSNSTSWVYTDMPYNATQIEVDAGLNNNKFVTPLTFTNAAKWNTKVSSVTGPAVDNTDPLNPVIQLPTNLTFYSTTAASDIVGYNRLVIDITDPDYDSPAVDVSTGSITTTAQPVGVLVADAGVFAGNPGIINISTVGEIRRVSGSGTAEFYYEVYLRDSLGVETLVATSNVTPAITGATYEQFSASALLNNGTWTATDRVVIKYFANRIPGASDPTYEFNFGGANPVRTLFPISASLLLNVPVSIGITGVTGGTPGSALIVDPSGLLGQVSNPVTGTGASGQVSYWTGTGTQSGSNNLFWDAVNNRLGIGTITPSKSFVLKLPSVNDDGFIITSSTNSTLFELTKDGSSNNTAEFYVWSAGVRKFGIRSNSNLSFFNGGDFAFGTTSVTGARLTVRGSGTTSATTALLVQNSGASELFKVADNGVITFGTSQTFTVSGTYESFGSNINFFNSTVPVFNLIASFSSTIGFSGTQAYFNGRVISQTANINNTSTSNNITCAYFSTRTASSGAGNSLTGVVGDFQIEGTGNVTNAVALDLSWRKSNTSIITNAYGIRINNLTNTGGTITNTYGIYIGDITAGTQTNTPYAIYSEDASAVSYIAGNTAIGTTTTSGGRLTVRGSGTTSATTALLVQNATPTNLLQVLDNGRINQNLEGTSNSTAFGSSALRVATGNFNTAFGFYAGYSNTTGNSNTFMGYLAGYSNTTGSNNTYIGLQAGRYAGSGTTANETSSNSIYVGYRPRASASGNTNEIVIGYDVVGNGSNTTTIGNTSTTNNYIYGNFNIIDKNLVFGTTTGTKIGTATNQKLAFWNATPVVQQTGDIPTALSNLGLVTSPTLNYSDIYVTTNRQTASYTLAISDAGKLVEMNVATANDLTVPLDSSVAFPIGTKIDIIQYGAGQTTVVATGGVTIRSANNWVKINARYGAATLVKIGTDEWYLFGNLNA